MSCGARLPHVDQLPHARSEPARLSDAPGSRRVLDERIRLGVYRVLVDHDQLDHRLRRSRVPAPREQRPEVLTQGTREGSVQSREDLRARAEVGLQRRPAADLFEARSARLEQLDVGMPEAVDRLLGIADHEHVGARDEVDQLELDAVGVLHLVDHHAGEPLAVAGRRSPAA